ncbi:MAG: phosphodiester glycosidase family protein [Victivallaceae bacterium]|nr:phosphodiester glycosidase family protein [Victivallaceae bacterium]
MMKLFSMLLAAMLALSLFGDAIDWSKADDVGNGMLFLRLALQKPCTQKVCILRIDVSNPKLRFTATRRDPLWGRPMPDRQGMTIRTKRVTTADFMMECRSRRLDLVAAFNAAPWVPWEKPFNHRYGDPSGVNITDGIVITDHRGKSPAFVVYKNRALDIVDEVPVSDYGKIKVAASGFSIVLRKDSVIAPDSDMTRHPRMGYGLSADKKYFYVITVDGREPGWSDGATLKELALLFVDAGAADAINMDGGGSTTLCLYDANKEIPVMMNHHKGNGRRNVASNIGVYVVK